MENRISQNGNARSIVALSQFIQATRDSGYKSTVSAISELVDNALQAKAKNIDILFVPTTGNNVGCGTDVIVLDDGQGMDKLTLQNALRFGGSSRFNDRRGLGRYGMGLPNASLSQAKRVEVWSWQNTTAKSLYSYLDIDEVVSGEQTDIHVSRPMKLQYSNLPKTKKSGTLVHLTHCDRLDHKRISTLRRKLETNLGRMFRHFLWSEIKIRVDDQLITGRDPLYVQPNGRLETAELFNKPLELEVRSNFDDPLHADIGLIRVSFSELPIAKWQSLPNAEKRKLGIANGAGVSIVRNRREIDYGWFFMGKRKENYDDWWRCEIQFDPILDDVFGITHTKQQIRPHPELKEILEATLGPTANALNARARDKHRIERFKPLSLSSESRAQNKEHQLTPMHARIGRQSSRNKQILELIHDSIGPAAKNLETIEYKIVQGSPSDPAFFTPTLQNSRLSILVNEQHLFFNALYAPLMAGDLSNEETFSRLQSLLFAAGRAENQAKTSAEQRAIAKFRDDWSNALAAFL